MSDLLCSVILFVSSLFGCAVFLMILKRRDEYASSIWLLLMCASNILWALSSMLFYFVPSLEAALLFDSIRYAFIMASAWFLYIFVHRTLSHRLLNWKFFFLVFLLPAATLVIVISNPYDNLLRHSVEFVQASAIRSLSYEYGAWFLVHCFMSYVPLFSAAVIIGKQLFHLPPKYKFSAGLMLTVIIMVFASTLLYVLNVLPVPFDPTPVFIQTIQVVFYNSLFNSRSLDMLFTSRDIIFENSNSLLLVLDTRGTIMDFNKKAAELAKQLSIDNLFGMNAESFVQKWKTLSCWHIFEEDASIFSVIENGVDAHYQIQTAQMLRNGVHVIGSYMEIKNITPIMSLIHMLQDAAHFDNLTGLPNRNYFYKRLAEMDRKESLPLCIVVGDVNNLKKVNDNYGHVKGDQLLKLISSILLECGPENALFSRIGGDEFVGLIPNVTELSVDQFVAKVEDYCRKIVDPDFKDASIALGYKIKTQEHEDIVELMNEADVEMYTTKKDRRNSSS